MSEFPNEKYFNLDFSTSDSQFDLGFGASVSAGDFGVFWAKYGETSFSAVQTAHRRKFAVFLLRGDMILPLVEITEDYALFGSISQIWAYYSSVNSVGTWASNDVQLASQNMIPYQVAEVLKDLTDSALSDDSKNPVQNKVVKAAVDAKYAKPSTGIPATDLASDVQTSLGKADTALQEHQSLAAYRTAADQDVIDAAQDTAISSKLSTTGNAYRAASIPMGKLDSTSTATVMTATVPGITELRDGVCMWLENGVITSASGFTLNINGLGAKPVYGSLAAATQATSQFNVNYTMLFIYNSSRVSGGCWDISYGYDSNTTYTPPKLGFCYVNVGGEANDPSKIGTNNNYQLATGGIVVGKFLHDAPAGSTLNISGRGAKPIYFRNAALPAGVIKGGDTVTLVYYPERYYLMANDRWQVDIDNIKAQLDALVVADNVGY